MSHGRPRLLDLYCCQGGASAGYVAAGFEVVGVDIKAQPRYPFPFHQGDALEFLAEHGHEFDAIHASPPCQAFSLCQRIRHNDHPELIGPTRDLLVELGVPWVMENVPGAPLRNPIELCGAMFGLHTYRHRLFEASFPFQIPAHAEHSFQTVKMGRALQEGDWYHAVGNFSNVAYVRKDFGVPWMNREGIREAIPPAYSHYLGDQLRVQLSVGEVAA